MVGGAKVPIEASGHASAYNGLFDLLRPGGLCIAVGIPGQAVPFTILPMLRKELRFATVYRYANVFAPTLDLIASGTIDLKPLVTGTFDFGFVSL